jgi:hypothetical protein
MHFQFQFLSTLALFVTERATGSIIADGARGFNKVFFVKRPAGRAFKCKLLLYGIDVSEFIWSQLFIGFKELVT